MKKVKKISPQKKIDTSPFFFLVSILYWIRYKLKKNDDD